MGLLPAGLAWGGVGLAGSRGKGGHPRFSSSPLHPLAHTPRPLSEPGFQSLVCCERFALPAPCQPGGRWVLPLGWRAELLRAAVGPGEGHEPAAFPWVFPEVKLLVARVSK